MSGTSRDDVVTGLRAALAAAGDPSRAAAQQAYMKSAMPYRGLTAPQLRETVRPWLDAAPYRMRDRAEWAATIRELWDGASHREERYVAVALARHRHYRGWRDAAMLPLWRHLVVTGAWWDHVDEIAAHLVGPALRSEPAVTRPVIQEWAVGDDLWLRRTAILAQLGAGSGTDVPLLEEVVVANLEPRLAGTPLAREFFLRKAIGWALREYARTDPAWVRGFVAEHESQLSGLSRREALKHLR